MVTVALPIRPAIRMPLNTRPGVEQPPMEPGDRCLRCTPWPAPRPSKPWRFMTPAVPLPLLVPVTSTQDAGVEDLLGGQFLAHLVAGDVVGAQLGDVTARRDAGLREVAGLRLVDLRGSIAPKANCTPL